MNRRVPSIGRTIALHLALIGAALLLGVVATALRPGGFAQREAMAAAIGRNCGVIDRGPFVAAGGAVAVLLWMSTYSSIILNRSREPGIPLLVACLMWGHELCHTVFIRFDGTAAMDVLEGTWLVLNSVIVVQGLRRTRSMVVSGVVLVALFGATVLNLWAVQTWALGATLAFGINLVIALAFAVRVARGGEVSGWGLVFRAAAGVVVLGVNTLGFPHDPGFAAELCQRSPNNAVSVWLLCATVLVDGWTLLRWRYGTRSSAERGAMAMPSGVSSSGPSASESVSPTSSGGSSPE
ncbi:MAG: hypothetical protein AAF799_32685 [Myxococcota bacterium]